MREDTLSTEQNIAVVRRFVDEVQNEHNLDVIDELFSPDCTNHTQPAGMPEVAPGPAAFKEFFGSLLQGFPDASMTIEDQVAEGDKVVTRKTLRANHKGELFGIPATGKPVEIGIIDIWRVQGGKLTDHWGIVDQMGMMQQMGLMPSPE